MTWKRILNNSYQNGDDIKSIFNLDKKQTSEINLVSKQYPMLVNEYYCSLIDYDNPMDPIKKMAIPSILEISEEGDTDTSGEHINTVLKGVQHKYKQTALILSTNACFMYCRHCFRKRMVGISDIETVSYFEHIRDYIKDNPEISNVLISGGDAFFNSNEIIEQYLQTFSELKQLDFVRFGTRALAVLPQRIYEDDILLKILKKYNEKKQIYIVTQFNHPNELTTEAFKAINSLKSIGIIIKNQTVLLKDINDSPEVISQLLSKLTAYGIVPYYIFQCRPVRGVINHFQVPLKKGYSIIDKAKNLQNGQGKCVRYVLSHPTGKIEVIGEMPTGEMIFKYHQAKESIDANRIFLQYIASDQCWI